MMGNARRHAPSTIGWRTHVGTLACSLVLAASAHAQSIVCDVVQPCTIATTTATCTFSLTVAAGETVQVTVGETSAGFTARWRLIGPASNCTNLTTATLADCGPLAEGTYQIEVSSSSGTGTADVHFQRLTAAQACDSTPIGCDAPQSVTIGAAVENDLFRFSVADLERVQVTLAETTAGFTASWRLLSATGAPASSCGNSTTATTLDCGPLTAGTYNIEVASFTGTGTADLHLQRLAAAQACDSPPILCDVPQTADISPAVDNDPIRAAPRRKDPPTRSR